MNDIKFHIGIPWKQRIKILFGCKVYMHIWDDGKTIHFDSKVKK